MTVQRRGSSAQRPSAVRDSLELGRQRVGGQVARENDVVDLERAGVLEDAADGLRRAGERTRPAAEGELHRARSTGAIQAQERVPAVVGRDVDVREVEKPHRAPGS